MTFWQKVKKFLKDLFTKNIAIKIISIILAILLWIVFAAVEDPAVTETYSIPLKVLNLEEYESAGHYVHLEKGGDIDDIRLDVTIRAPKSVLQEISFSGPEKAIEASADVFDIENGIMTIHYSVLEDYVGKVEFNTISNTSFLNVIKEDIVSKTVNIKLELVGTPTEGYFVPATDFNRSLSTQTVTVSGPQSLMEQLDHAAVVYSMDGLKESVNEVPMNLRYIDKAGKEMNLPASICNFSATLVSVNIPLYRVYSLNLTLETVGEPMEGWKYVEDGELSKTQVQVYALAEAANCPSSMVIVQSIYNQAGTVTWEKDLAKLVSQNYSYLHLYSQEDSSIEITITFVQEEKE